jgi:hypothetical protein
MIAPSVPGQLVQDLRGIVRRTMGNHHSLLNSELACDVLAMYRTIAFERDPYMHGSSAAIARGNV